MLSRRQFPRLRQAALPLAVLLLTALPCLPPVLFLHLPAAAAVPLAALPVLAALLSILLRRAGRRSLSELNAALRRAADGDYSVRIPAGRGPLGELHRSFNEMAAALDGRVLLHGDFAGALSHEFKTPINAIYGFAGQLRRKELDRQTSAQYLDRILLESRRLASLSDSILELLRMEQQGAAVPAAEFAPDEQIVQCILGLQTQWETRGLRFDMQLPPLRYRGSETLTYHIWQNLLSNAVKFTPEGGVIHLNGVQYDHAVEVRIRDEGPGMPPEVLAHIFEPFYRAGSAKGCGLGLPLARRAAALCGGRIDAESAPGRGSLFTVWLPFAEEVP